MVFGAEPERECPTCGALSRTVSPVCPSCGKRYDRRAPWLGTRARVALGLVGVLVLLGGVAIAAPSFRDEKRAEESTARTAREKAVAAEIERLVREQRPVRGAAPASFERDDRRADDTTRRTQRRRLVTALEQGVLAEARKRVDSGEMDGPIVSSECGPLTYTAEHRTDDEDLERTHGRYDCVAVKADVTRTGKKVGSFGHPFVATIDFAAGTWVMCKDNKVPGERGRALAKARLDAACVGADGARVVGDGYAEPSS